MNTYWTDWTDRTGLGFDGELLHTPPRDKGFPSPHHHPTTATASGGVVQTLKQFAPAAMLGRGGEGEGLELGGGSHVQLVVWRQFC